MRMRWPKPVSVLGSLRKYGLLIQAWLLGREPMHSDDEKRRLLPMPKRKRKPRQTDSMAEGPQEREESARVAEEARRNLS